MTAGTRNTNPRAPILCAVYPFAGVRVCSEIAVRSCRSGAKLVKVRFEYSCLHDWAAMTAVSASR